MLESDLLPFYEPDSYSSDDVTLTQHEERLLGILGYFPMSEEDSI